LSNSYQTNLHKPTLKSQNQLQAIFFLACKHCVVLAITIVESSGEQFSSWFLAKLYDRIKVITLKANLKLKYSRYAYAQQISLQRPSSCALRGVKNSSNCEKEETESHMEHRITTRFMSGRVEMEMSVDQCLT